MEIQRRTATWRGNTKGKANFKGEVVNENQNEIINKSYKWKSSNELTSPNR